MCWRRLLGRMSWFPPESSTPSREQCSSTSPVPSVSADGSPISTCLGRRHFYKLTDIADVQRGYSDPPTKMFRVNGKPAIGIGVNMRDGGNNLDFGEGLHRRPKGRSRPVLHRHRARIWCRPAGGRRAKAIGEFTEALCAGDRYRARGSFRQPRLRAGLSSRCPSRWCWRSSSSSWRRWASPAPHLAGRADHRAGPAGRRRHDDRGRMMRLLDDGDTKDQAATFAYPPCRAMLIGTLVTIAASCRSASPRTPGEYTLLDLLGRRHLRWSCRGS